MQNGFIALQEWLEGECNISIRQNQLDDLAELELDLEGKIQSYCIPENISWGSNLTSINLKHNRLSNIPQSLGNIVTLKKLNLSDNLLSTIPKEISKIYLEVLDIRNNPFLRFQISQEGSRFLALRELYIDISRISSATDISLNNFLYYMDKFFKHLTNQNDNQRESDLEILEFCVKYRTDEQLDLVMQIFSTIFKLPHLVKLITNIDFDSNSHLTLPNDWICDDISNTNKKYTYKKINNDNMGA